MMIIMILTYNLLHNTRIYLVMFIQQYVYMFSSVHVTLKYVVRMKGSNKFLSTYILIKSVILTTYELHFSCFQVGIKQSMPRLTFGPECAFAKGQSRYTSRYTQDTRAEKQVYWFYLCLALIHQLYKLKKSFILWQVLKIEQEE